MNGTDSHPLNDLERAIRLATDAYSGQTDKAGETYLRHPLRVMDQMDTETEQIVAVLHDVVEDSDYELDEIEPRFGTTVREAVDVLTKRDGESYADAIDRAGANSSPTRENGRSRGQHGSHSTRVRRRRNAASTREISPLVAATR